MHRKRPITSVPRAIRSVAQALEPRTLLTSISGNVFYDDDLDGTQAAGEADLSQWVVFLDSNNNNVVDGVSGTWNSGGSSFAIADKSTYTIPITVSGATGTIADVDVRINLAHAYLSDVDVFLTAPNGVKIELSTDNGGTGHDYINTIFDDDAPRRINGITTSTNSARYRPEFSMGRWHGSSINGTWTLEVSDDSLGDTGTFYNWGLTIRNGEPDATTYTDGGYLLETAASGSLTVRPVIQSGYVAHRNSASLTVSAGGSATNVNFGVRLPPASIGGRVFNDTNVNGVQDAGEGGIPARTVFLDANDNGQLDPGERSVTTNAAGDYLFTGVKPQPHPVRTVLPHGWTQTSPASAAAMSSPAVVDSRASATREYVPGQLIVASDQLDQLTSLLRSRASRDLLDAIDPGSRQTLGDGLAILAVRDGYDPLKVATRLARVAGIKFASVNFLYRRSDPREYTPSDPQFPSQGFHTRIGSTSAWDLSEGAGVKVAVIDDGVLLSHPDLSPNLWTNAAEIANNGIDDDHNGYIDDRSGWDFTGSTSMGTGDANPNPENGDSHGTHIAGVIAARTNNAINVAGVAGKATIIPIRFFGTGAWTSAVIYNAFKYAADLGAKIVNVSYNIDQFVDPLDPTYNAAVEYLDARNVLHINSAGNENALDPARTRMESTLYVTAVGPNDRKITDSNFGTGVDLSAPGEPVLSTTNNAGSPSTGTMGGTSVAAAVASGVAALIWARNPTWTRDQVVAQLLGTADNIDAANPDHLGLLGSGRVNAFKAVSQSLSAPQPGEIVGLPADGATVVLAPSSFEVRIPDVLDATRANAAGNWTFISAGADGTFGTGDDANVPFSRSTYRVGSNGIRFVINQVLTPGVYRFTARSGSTGLADPFGRQLDGDANGVAGGDRVLTFTLSTLAAARIVTPAPGSSVRGQDFATAFSGDAVGTPPTIDAALLTLETAQRITLALSEDVRDIPASAISVRNLSTGTVVASSRYWTFYDAGARRLLVQMNGSGLLDDGSYRLTVAAGGVVDNAGTPMARDYAFDFAINRADFDRSGSADFNDLLILAQHYAQAGNFSAGDTNYDGVVNYDDLLALAQRYAGPAQLSSGLSASGAATRRAGHRLAVVGIV